MFVHLHFIVVASSIDVDFIVRLCHDNSATVLLLWWGIGARGRWCVCEFERGIKSPLVNFWPLTQFYLCIYLFINLYMLDIYKNYPNLTIANFVITGIFQPPPLGLSFALSQSY